MENCTPGAEDIAVGAMVAMASIGIATTIRSMMSSTSTNMLAPFACNTPTAHMVSPYMAHGCTYALMSTAAAP